MKRFSRVQRIARTEEKAVVKRIFWLTLLSILLIGAIFTVGVNFLGNFADFLDRVFGTAKNESQVNGSLRPPILDLLPKVTNKEKITLSGFSEGGNRVEFYLDSKKVGETNVVDNNFEFKDLSLFEGENKIAVKSVNNQGDSSEPSVDVIVVLDTKEPPLEITSPVDGQTFNSNNRIKVLGKTEEDAQVFANGFLANVDSDGNFEVSIPLGEGENKIEVKAQDEAGNEKVKELKAEFKK